MGYTNPSKALSDHCKGVTKRYTPTKSGYLREFGFSPGVGKDLAQILGYAKPENALAAHVDDEDKTTTLIQGIGSNYKSKTIVINESGLYSLVLSSKLPGAKKFKRWVTTEVLPTIRKNGEHSTAFSRHKRK